LISKEDKFSYIAAQLSESANSCFQNIPKDICLQLLMDRDPHGNVQVSKIETERLFIESVSKELKQRAVSNIYQGKFNPQPHFCGYEGRSGLPSNFDAQYCYALGHVAALLVDASLTGYICCVQNLSHPVEEWQIGARTIASMMTIEERHGQEKLVIRKALVDLQGIPFTAFKAKRDEWKLKDDYVCSGPIQFYGSNELTDAITLTLAYESKGLKRGALNSNLESAVPAKKN
jgi:pyrophosphate--fructose-6-phosphate 1-phosphotransferase